MVFPREAGRRRGERRAMAVPMVVIIVIILVIVFMGMSTFQRFQVKATGAASGNLIAFTAAEAGLAAAVGELQASAAWATHEVDPSSLGAGKTTSDLAWSSTELDHLNVLHGSKRKDDAGIACDIADAQNTGTYAGTVGEGNFKGEFRVRCGRIPYADLAETRSRNEAERFYLIDSMGRHGDRAVRIRAIVEASNFTEFVIYDADFLELGMGMKDDSANTNLFANGELYGGAWVKLGHIESGGTRQEFKNMGKIQSAGPIIAEDPFTIEFSSPSGSSASLAAGFDSSASASYDTAGDNLVDGAHGGGFPAPNLPWDYYESLKDAGLAARVSAYSGAGSEQTEHNNPHSGDQDVVVLDFGKNQGCEPMTASGGDDPISKPGSWDGLLYNDTGKALVVFGCPDTDLTIVSEQDVYLCGDFNQGLAKNPESNADLRLNQHYVDGKKAVNVEGDYGYMIFYDQAGSEPHRPCYLTDASNLGSDRLPANKRERHAVAIISKGRIWFDFRYPTRVCGNEIRPFLAYELARAAYTDAKERGETVDGGSPAEAAYKKWGCRKAESSVDRDDLILAVEDQSLGTWKLTTHVKEFFEDPWGSGDHGLLDLSDYADVKSAILAAGQAASDPDEPKIPEAKVDDILKKLWERLVKLDVEKKAGKNGGCCLYGPKSIFQAYYEKFWDGANKQQKSSVDSFSGIQAETDDFCLPEMTFNALLITSAKRNAEYWQPSAKSVSKAFDELGNADKAGSYAAYLTEPGKSVSSVIQRFVGAEIRLGKDLPEPRLTNAPYRPCIRKRIFDPTLHRHSPPHIPRTIVLRDWCRLGATPGAFEDF